MLDVLEADLVARTETPNTVTSLTADLRALGVERGDVTLVHASLSSVGWICGGVVALVQALLAAVGPAGTIVVPTQTTGNSEPAEWSNPPVPPAWWNLVRENLPPFVPGMTPSTGVGILPEVVRQLEGARRSSHPQNSFAAVGAAAEAVVEDHELASGFGEASPLARIYALGGKVLLIGVGHDVNTSMHLGESRSVAARPRDYGAAVLTPRGREWVTWSDVGYDAGDFALVGAAFDASGACGGGTVGAATARLMSQPALVDFSREWFDEHRLVEPS
jgi:aminoglycoside 3-N-acetyltransferase